LYQHAEHYFRAMKEEEQTVQGDGSWTAS